MMEQPGERELSHRSTARRPSLDSTRYGSFSREPSRQTSRDPSPERRPLMAEASTRLTVGPSFLATAQDSTPEDPGERSLPGQHTLRRWTKSTEHLVYKHSRDSRRFSSAFQGDPREEEALLGADTSESVQSAVLDADALEEQIHHKPYGVQKIQAITAKLRHQDFKALYMALYLLMFTTALESSASPVVEPYFLSSFHLHSLLASMGILTNIGVALIRPLMAKILDIFGRAEGIALAAFLYLVGYLLISASNSVVLFAIAKVVGSFGAQGLHLSISVLIADTTSLSNRALVNSSTSIPWFITIWIGPPLGQFFLAFGSVGYRSIYAIFAILVPILCFPLIYGLHRTYQRVTHAFHSRLRFGASYISSATAPDEQGYLAYPQEEDIVAIQPQSFKTLLRTAREQVDVTGIFLLCASGILILLPLSLSAAEPESWKDLRLTGLITLGVLALYAFIRHENSTNIPFMPRRLIDNRTIRAGCLLGCFHFICQFTYESYFTSFLQVSRNLSARDAQYIQESYLFSAVLSGIGCGVASKYSRRYRVWGILGVIIHMIGAVVMVRFRKLTNPLWEIVAGQIIGGVGGGLTTCASQLGIQAVVPHQDVAMATAVLLAVTQVGAAIGASMSGAIWTSVLPQQLKLHLEPSKHDIIPNILGSLAYTLSFEPGTPERDAINAAYGRTQYYLNLTALLALLPALLSMLRMQNVVLTDEKGADAVVVLGQADDIEHESESRAVH